MSDIKERYPKPYHPMRILHRIRKEPVILGMAIVAVAKVAGYEIDIDQMTEFFAQFEAVFVIIIGFVIRKFTRSKKSLKEEGLIKESIDS